METTESDALPNDADPADGYGPAPPAEAAASGAVLEQDIPKAAEAASEALAAAAMELEQEGSLDQLQHQELLQERRMQDKRSKQKRVWSLKRKFGELTTQIEGAICEVTGHWKLGWVRGACSNSSMLGLLQYMGS